MRTLCVSGGLYGVETHGRCWAGSLGPSAEMPKEGRGVSVLHWDLCPRSEQAVWAAPHLSWFVPQTFSAGLCPLTWAVSGKWFRNIGAAEKNYKKGKKAVSSKEGFTFQRWGTLDQQFSRAGNSSETWTIATKPGSFKMSFTSLQIVCTW